MIRIELAKVLGLLGYIKMGKAPSVSELSRRTGISRNTITKILNDPTANITTEHLNRLVHYLFTEFSLVYENQSDSQTAEEILEELIVFDPHLVFRPTDNTEEKDYAKYQVTFIENEEKFRKAASTDPEEARRKVLEEIREREESENPENIDWGEVGDYWKKAFDDWEDKDKDEYQVTIKNPYKKEDKASPRLRRKPKKKD